MLPIYAYTVYKNYAHIICVSTLITLYLCTLFKGIVLPCGGDVDSTYSFTTLVINSTATQRM
jgi:hypothetical protein